MNDERKDAKPTFSWGPFKNVPMAGWVVALASLIGLAVVGVYAYKTSREILQIVPDHLVKFVALEAAKPSEAARHYFETEGEDFEELEQVDGTIVRYHNIDSCHSFLFPGQTSPDFMFHPQRRGEIVEAALRGGVQVGFNLNPVDNTPTDGRALHAAVAFTGKCGDPGPGCCIPNHLGDYKTEHTKIRDCVEGEPDSVAVYWLITTFEDGCKARRKVDLCAQTTGPLEWLVCVHTEEEVDDEKDSDSEPDD